ncbi:DUF397 domain-containing protein [Streptomyces colonosanans]|uniref:DUF397 domain-containing protein n=1 Tax=Streptomyces colonosanans TaxID=1428652 RepID=A0A1S2PBB5_9ACTN|nr:DUF397 domain-containing protein [Streptomyces colonosanans]OIJ90902.1 hypothetical protein BIV24_17130 [Streptomyces colonosanans]
MHESNTLDWRTSSYSGGNGACVEVAKTGAGAHFRDTKDRPRGATFASDTAWGAFLHGVKAGAFSA